MTISTQRKILEKIAANEGMIADLERVVFEVATSGYASASISSGGGSKSYTRADVGKLTALIQHLRKQITGWRRMLGGRTGPAINTIETVWS